MSKQGLVTEINSNSSVPPKTDEVVSSNTRTAASNIPASGSIPVIEEQANVGTELVDVAKVRLSKTVENSIEAVDVQTSEEQVIVQRVPKNVIVDAIPEGVRYEGDVMIIPVLKEVAVVERKIMLVEEIHISRKTTHQVKTVEVKLRKENVEVERIPLRKEESSSGENTNI